MTVAAMPMANKWNSHPPDIRQNFQTVPFRRIVSYLAATGVLVPSLAQRACKRTGEQGTKWSVSHMKISFRPPQRFLGWSVQDFFVSGSTKEIIYAPCNARSR
jgi:hypothetical protein